MKISYKTIMKKVMKDNFLKVDVQYLEKLHELHNDLRSLPGRMKIEKVKKLVANLLDKTEYIIQIRNFKEALNDGLLDAWLKTYIYMNTDLRKKQKAILRSPF